MDALLNLALGVIASFLAWWVLFHGIVPKIKFSNGISKLPTGRIAENQSGWKYRVKLGNYGRRNAIDVQVRAKLSIKGLNPLRSDNLQIVYLPLDGDRSFAIPRIMPQKKGHARSTVLALEPNLADEFRNQDIYPEDFRDLARAYKLTMEDVLALGAEAKLEMMVFGYDDFSGARKLFWSRAFTSEDIGDGPFEKGGLNLAV